MNDWEIILNQAKKLAESKAEWNSLGGNVKYRFFGMDSNRIVVDRISGGDLAVIGKIGATRAISRLRQLKQIPKTDLINSVVRQTTLVFLHPSIVYDVNTKMICWTENNFPLENLQDFINEAEDDQLNKIQIIINQRKNQSKFKSNLIKVYNGKCAITGIQIEELLEAAHINPHSKSGVNKSANGILLRSDIHTLFDNELMKIRPKDYKVKIHKSLFGTEYERYHNLRIKLPERCREFLILKYKKISHNLV